MPPMQKLCHIFGMRARDVHVFTERVGGGFGGKQEMLSEDLCVLATLKTGRPVKVRLEKQGGTYTVPVVINNAIRLNFILDSGASDVLIPGDVFLTLVRTGQ